MGDRNRNRAPGQLAAQISRQDDPHLPDIGTSPSTGDMRNPANRRNRMGRGLVNRGPGGVEIPPPPGVGGDPVPPAPYPAPPEVDVASDPAAQLGQEDFIGEILGQYAGHIEPWAEDARAGIDQYGRELGAGADRYESDVRGGDGFQALQGAADKLLELYEQGGRTDVTRAQLESNRRNADQFVRSNREATLQDLAERGMAGGGAEVASMMGDRAAAADRMNANDLDAAAFGQESALQALLDSRDVNSELEGIERGVSGERLAANAVGAQAGYDLSDRMANLGMGLATDLHRSFVKSGQNTFENASANAPGAARNVADTAGGTFAGAQGGAMGLLGSGANNMDFDMPGMGGVPAPSQGGPDPIANRAGAGGSIMGGAGDAAGAVAGALGNLGGTQPQGNNDTARTDQLGFTGYVPPPDSELEDYG